MNEDSPKRILHPPIYFAVCLAIIIALSVYSPIHPISSKLVKYTGGFISIIALVIFYDSVRRFKRAQTKLRPFEESTCLITGGFYRYSRNPIYLAMLMLLIGAELQIGTGLGFIPIVLFFLIIKIRFVHFEEKMMADTFGEAYLEFKEKTRRWL